MNRNPFQLVLIFLGSALLLSVLGEVVLAIMEKDSPDVLAQVIVGALTGLGGLLARTPRDGAEAVTIANSDADPVPVAETPGPATARNARRRASRVAPAEVQGD